MTKPTDTAPAGEAGAAPLDLGFDVDDAAAAELAHLLAELGDEPADPVDAAPAGEPAAGESADEPVDETPAGPEPVEPPTVAEITAAAEELAMLDALHKSIGDEYKARKAAHEPLFAAAVNAGMNRQIPLVLPDDGTQIGTWNVEGSDTVTLWDGEAALAYVREHSPHNLYETVSDRALNYPDVIEYIRLTHPELITEAVRPAYLTVLEQALDAEGRAPDPRTGELIPLARRERVPSTGKGRAGWKRPKGGPSGREQLVAAWRDGRLRGRIALDPPPAAAGE